MPRSGAPHKRWRQMLEAQGANLSAFDKKLARPEKPIELKSDRAGRITDCNARIIGEVIRDLGGGRINKDSAINHNVGLDQIAKPTDRIDGDSILCRIHGVRELSLTMRSTIVSAFTISK